MGKTALDLTPEDWQAYQPTKIQGTLAEENTFVTKRNEQAWQLARQAARILREKFEAQRVVLFGSLASKGTFTLWSDIDLIAWGIPAARFYAAVATVTGLSPDFKVDLIDPDTCRPGILAVAEREGVEL
jgi:predicted nucleotidyltransferase